MQSQSFSSVNIHIHSYTQVTVCRRVKMTDTYTHPDSRLTACTNTHSSFTLTGAFPLHTCSITCNFCTYFTHVGRVFLVETVILQTVLLDIRAWSTSFYVLSFLWRHCFADGWCLFKQRWSIIYYWNQYNEDIYKSLGPSVCW